MAQFPTSIPTYTGFTSSHTLSQDQHASQHNSEQGDIVALATKLGTGSSTPTNNTVLRGNGAGTTAFDSVHLATDVSGVLPTANFDTVGALKLVYPVGCIYTETTGTNPATTFGFGTWSQTGRGQVLVGQGTSDQLFTAGTTGGESNHTLVSNEMPSHNHTINDPGHLHQKAAQFGTSGNAFSDYGAWSNVGGSAGGGAGNTNSSTTGITLNNTGGGAAHNNLQPYLVVYFWQRTL